MLDLFQQPVYGYCLYSTVYAQQSPLAHLPAHAMTLSAVPRAQRPSAAAAAAAAAAPRPPHLSSFPHLTISEFASAISTLYTTLPRSPATRLVLQPPTLTLRRPLRPPTPTPTPTSPTPSSPSSDIEDDPEALPPPPPPPPPTPAPAAAAPYITYQLHHSLSYNVPVLYFRPSTPMSLAEIYERVVPTASAEALRRVGVLGAVSQADNPSGGGEVWWFVHPCSTAEAMAELRGLWAAAEPEPGGERMPAEVRYVRIWLGLVGGVVGLRLEDPEVAAVGGGELERGGRDRVV